ncbi:MAG: hypothetical protein AB1586_03640 [Pseudomonadota bacterium]
MPLIDTLIVTAALLFMVAVFACALAGKPSSSAMPHGSPRRKRRAF